VRKGYRGVFEPRAVCQEEVSDNRTHEFGRQVRIINRTLGAIVKHRDLLNPFSYGWFSVQLFTHKLLRFATPFFLLGLLTSSLLLAEEGEPYRALLGVQVILYGCAVWGLFTPSRSCLGKLTSCCTYFVIVNAAYLAGWLRFLADSPDTIWEKSR